MKTTDLHRHRRLPAQRLGAAHTRGAASLIVVMVLFFLMSLAAAYTSRNLIFEQRTSVNQYRSVQAFEAAEAGLEWALAQLNGGRIDASCLEAGAGAGDTSFRQRYLNVSAATGMVTTMLQAGGQPRRAGCVWNGAGWTCSCPTDTDPALAAPVGSGSYPAFWVSFRSAPDIAVTRPGVVQIVVNGCTRMDTNCLASVDASIDQEGRALLTELAALKSALATMPAAALTTFGAATGGAAGVNTVLVNSESDRGGVTLQAGGVANAATFDLSSTPGTPGPASVVASDTTLSALLNALPADLAGDGYVPNDRAFSASFSSWPTPYRVQPGAITLACPAGGCSAALANKVAMNPDRVIWITGDLTLEAAVNIGSTGNPVAIVVAGDGVGPGNVSLAAGVTVYGVVYSRGAGAGPGPGPIITWTGPGRIQGAGVVEGDLTATAAPTVVYDGTILDTLHWRSGSFVRVPGSWRDLP